MDIHSEIEKYDNIIFQLQHKRDELKKQANFCESCMRYYPKSEGEQTTEKVKNIECVYRDCGYGDDDLYAEVERIITYNICPICGHKEYNSSIVISEGPSKRRWE